MSRLPPGPRDWLLGFGNLNCLRKDPLAFVVDLGQKYGDISCFRVPLPPFYIWSLNHPDLIREFLVTKAKSFRKIEKATRVLKQIVGNGLLISEGDLWLRQRRLIQPAFHASRMTRHAQVVVERTRRMLDSWHSGALLDIPEEMRQLTLAIIAKALFDVELTGQGAKLSEVSRILAKTTLREISSLFTLPDWLPLPGKLRKRWALRTLDNLIGEIIRARRASGEDKGDLLSMLLLAVDEQGDRQGMTNQQARDEAKSLFTAGHDTVAAALTWTWYAIASHPDVEARLIQEVETVLGKVTPTVDDVPRLSYVGMVVKESLRLYPPVWGLATREAVADVELGGYEIPKGSWIFSAPYVIHRDPRFFANPDQFDPERFAAGRAEQIPPCAYVPFGAGPHVCVGNTFAIMEMVLVVSTILQQVRLTLAPGPREVEPEADIVIRPKGSLQMTVSKGTDLAMVRTQ